MKRHARKTLVILYFVVVPLITAALMCASACGQDGPDVSVSDGTPIGVGGGFSGVPPSYLVVLKVSDSPFSRGWLGSGTFITDRLVLTCYHNVRDMDGQQNLGIHTTSGKVYWDTEVVHEAPEYDLALILITEPITEYHRAMTVKSARHVSNNVSLMGFEPAADGLSLHGGRLTDRRYGDQKAQGEVYLETSAKIVEGMSGGPMVDESLQLVGVGVAKSDTGSMVVLLTRVQEFLDSYDGETGTFPPEIGLP